MELTRADSLNGSTPRQTSYFFHEQMQMGQSDFVPGPSRVCMMSANAGKKLAALERPPELWDGSTSAMGNSHVGPCASTSIFRGRNVLALLRIRRRS